MPLQSSGAISLNDIQTEFGGTNPISISEYYSAASGIPASGTIALDDFYGTSSNMFQNTLTVGLVGQEQWHYTGSVWRVGTVASGFNNTGQYATYYSNANHGSWTGGNNSLNIGGTTYYINFLSHYTEQQGYGYFALGLGTSNGASSGANPTGWSTLTISGSGVPNSGSVTFNRTSASQFYNGGQGLPSPNGIYVWGFDTAGNFVNVSGQFGSTANGITTCPFSNALSYNSSGGNADFCTVAASALCGSYTNYGNVHLSTMLTSLGNPVTITIN